MAKKKQTTVSEAEKLYAKIHNIEVEQVKQSVEDAINELQKLLKGGQKDEK